MVKKDQNNIVIQSVVCYNFNTIDSDNSYFAGSKITIEI